MKNKLSSYLWKIATAALLTVMLVGGVVCVTDVKGTDAYAATYGTGEEIELEDADYKIVKYSSISRTKDTATGLYKDVPQYTDPNGAEWLFAGWYYNEELTHHVPRSETEATDVYAKFVSADILTVKCQTSNITTPDSSNTVLRCVSSVDSLMYNRIGFDIIQPNAEGNLDYENIPEKSDNKVGVRIYANTDEDAYTYSPKVVDTESEYFFSTTITIDDSAFGFRHLIKPYWITKDGTKVYGVSRYVTVNEGLNKDIIHATIKMEAPEATNSYTTDVTDATVTYIDHDGTYAHFAISVSDRTALKSLTKFVISDANGELGAYYYRNLLTSYTGSNADDSWYEACKDTEDEFVVATSADLYGMSSAVMDSKDDTNKITFAGKTIYLVSDIIANSVKVTDKNDGTKEYDWTIGSKHIWTPLASNDHRFAGVFDGQGHTIKGLYVEGKEYQGLFAATGTQATVQNFNLKDSYMSGDNSSAEKPYVRIGSVAGVGNGTFNDIYSDATILCDGELCGGIVGYLDATATYEDCNFAGTLTMAQDSVKGGGIVGCTGGTEVSIKGCIFSGIITGYGSSSTTKLRIGGICGYFMNPSLIIENCISVGKITTNLESSNGHVGNIVGTQKNGDQYKLSVSNTYNLSDDLNQVGSAKSVTVATKYSQSVDLKWYDVSPGGCVISDADDLYGVYLLSLTKGNLEGQIIRLDDDITLSNTEDASNWTPISEFAGTLDGNGYTISGIHVSDSTENSGMFRVLTGATIKNLRIANSTFTNSESYIGAIAGKGYGTFEKIQIADSVSVSVTGSGKTHAAGILGQTSESKETTFTQCWNAGAIKNKNSSYAGGFVSLTNAAKITFTDCLNTGSVNAKTNCAGGFIGYFSDVSAECDMIRCVNAGDISVGNNYKGALVGAIQEGANGMKVERCYNTNATITTFVGRRATLLSYATDKATDCIDGSGLSAETFASLDESVWTITTGVVPTLKCFE